MKWVLLLLALFFWLVAFATFGASSTIFGQGIAAAFVVSGTVALVGFAIVDRLDAAARATRAAQPGATPAVDPYAGA